MEKKDNKLERKRVLTKSLLILVGIIGSIFGGLSIYKFLDRKEPVEFSNSKKIETVKESLPTDVIWQEHLESGLKHEEELRKKESLEIIAKLKETKEKLDSENYQNMKRLENELEDMRQELDKLKSDKKRDVVEQKQVEEKHVGVNSFEEGQLKEKDISHYLPQTAYVKARLLNGISVSTGAHAPSEPQPVVIRLTKMANLPRSFNFDICDCRVLAEGYGNLSSERVILRLTSLSCIDRKSQKAIETNIAGYVVGPDGLSGIKGNVVSVDGQHLRYAFVGGMLGGINIGSGKSGDGEKQKSILNKSGMKDMMLGGIDNGIANTSEKLMEYYIKRAESIQPVIEVGAGTEVEIVLTQGVFMGTSNVREVIKDARKN